ncbi:MAG: iron complex outermembrane receptor protein [Candidatus Azotimanducaceae bacterium]|jgi:iron complex outermembrane receptor protein
MKGIKQLPALVLGGLAINLVAPASIALAAEGRVIDEIIVQARRQDETLQDVPVSITSIGGDQLQNFQMDQVGEIAERIPNFNVQSGGSGSGGTLNLRGVGSSAISAAFDSAVALDIDGVTISRMRMVQSAFLDLEQVDVLKGPQSLYFGKSASAGVVAFRSANPGDELEAKLSAGRDFSMDGYYVDGFVSGPLSDNFGARFALRYSETDEIWENAAPGRPDDFGEEDFSARLTLAWDAADNLSLNFKTTITSREATDAVGNIDILCSVPGDPQPSNFAGQSMPSGHDCDSDDGSIALGGHNALFAQNVAGRINLEPYEELDTILTRLQVEWDINDSITLTSVSSYFKLEEQGAGSYGYDINGIGSNHTVNETEAFAQEFRLAGDINDSVSFILGAFYQDRELIFDTSQEAVGGANFAPLFGLPSIDPATGFSDDWRKIHTTDSQTQSIFASVTVQASERLELTAGARYSEEERTQDILVPHVHFFFDFLGLGFVPNGFTSGDIEFEDDNLSPELSFLYVLNDDINLYGAYKTGYKAGGVDNSALPSASLAAAAASGDFGALVYQTEEGEGFEFGMKGQFAAGSVRLDVTAFRYVYEDLQVQSFNASTVQFSTSNAGELVSQGLEADLTWLPNVDGLSVYGALSLLDAAFSDRFIPEPPAGVTDPAVLDQYDLDGRSTSGAADYAFNVGFDYSASFGNDLEWGLGLNTSFTDEYETQNEDPGGFIQESFWLVNGRAYIAAADGGWTVSVMGRNLADELYVVTSGGRPFADTSNNTLLPGGIGLSDTILNYARGRQVFLQLEVEM